MLQHFAQHDNDISQRRGDVARIYAVRAQDKRSLPSATHTHVYKLAWPLLPVHPCCRRRSASRQLATSSRSRAPLQSRNRARSLLSGPTKRGLRAWWRARNFQPRQKKITALDCKNSMPFTQFPAREQTVTEVTVLKCGPPP